MPAYLVARGLALTGGSVVSALLPLVVVVTFGGSARQVAGVLVVQQGTGLLLRYPMAVRVDEQGDSLRVQAAAQAAAAVTMLVVPVLWWLGWLVYPTLLLACAAFTVAETLVATSGYGVVNLLAAPGTRSRLTGRLQGLTGAARVTGQAAGPAALRWVPAPVAVLLGAALSGAAALVLWATFVRGPIPGRDEGGTRRGARSPWRSHGAALVDDLRALARTRPVLLLWLFAAGGGLAEPVIVIWAVRVLDVPAALVGVLLGFGAAGGIVGGVLVGPVTTRWSLPLVLAAGAALSAAAVPLLLVARAWTGSLLGVASAVAGYEAIAALAGTLAISATFGALQETASERRTSRTLSAAKVGLDVSLLTALLVGGVLGTRAGPAPVLALTATWFAGVAVWAGLSTGRAARPSPPA